MLLIDVLTRAYQTSLQVASFAVVVDAINGSAEQFYRKYGFLDLSLKNNKLFLPMEVVKQL